ncbi:Hypothetical protein GSB_13467 [Giardia duodenalis]|uniref:Uncharacterized protein n=2 Tax=Giardia intestinalis TaxID=5741 RepID=C6LUR5_GIAIB|nr:Hypothetical protein GL50581_2517 [Giardia intestinalis ATCC 50581]ESU42218.1 Hypothetical protein GSB_13467 [Giardia intestinalis]
MQHLGGVVQNIYSCRTMINNWVEERAYRDEVLAKYLDTASRGDLKSVQVIKQLENILKPVELTEGKVLFPNDRMMIINHNTKPFMLACDPRYAVKEYDRGSRVSFTSDIAPIRRSVFTVVRAQDSAVSDQGILKYGKRLKYLFKDEELANYETKMSTMSANNMIGEDAPIRYGERIYIACNQEMIDESDRYKGCGQVVLGCVRTTNSSVIHTVIGDIGCLHKDAEFVIEPYHASVRLEMEGHPVLIDQPVVIRHCSTGHCIGTGDAFKPSPTDLEKPEVLCQCKSVLNQYKREDVPNLCTITMGYDEIAD